jgi:hypothetical protein
MQITAAWAEQANGTAGKAPLFSHAVAAIATRLLMPSLADEKAAALAETEGLVSHLTSLVLIDEAGTQQNTLPVTRKVPLATPAIAAAYALSAPVMRASFSASLPADLKCYYGAHDLSHDLTPAKERAAGSPDRFDELAAKIDWRNVGVELANGQLTTLPAEIVKEIEALAQQPDVVQRAAELGLDPIKLVVALIAIRVWARNRAAARCAARHQGRSTHKRIARLNAASCASETPGTLRVCCCEPRELLPRVLDRMKCGADGSSFGI